MATVEGSWERFYKSSVLSWVHLINNLICKKQRWNPIHNSSVGGCKCAEIEKIRLTGIWLEIASSNWQLNFLRSWSFGSAHTQTMFACANVLCNICMKRWTWQGKCLCFCHCLLPHSIYGVLMHNRFNCNEISECYFAFLNRLTNGKNNKRRINCFFLCL